MANVKKTTNNKCCQGCGEKGTFVHLVRMQIGAATMENSMEIPQNFLKRLPYDPAILPVCIYLKKTKTLIQKDIYTPMLTAALFTIAKIWKQPKCPSIDEWIKRCDI